MSFREQACFFPGARSQKEVGDPLWKLPEYSHGLCHIPWFKCSPVSVLLSVLHYEPSISLSEQTYALGTKWIFQFGRKTAMPGLHRQIPQPAYTTVDEITLGISYFRVSHPLCERLKSAPPTPPHLKHSRKKNSQFKLKFPSSRTSQQLTVLMC